MQVNQENEHKQYKPLHTLKKVDTTCWKEYLTMVVEKLETSTYGKIKLDTEDNYIMIHDANV